MEPSEILRACEAYFESRPDVKLALVYGSAASGDLKGHSDVDIAILGDAPFAAKLESLERCSARIEAKWPPALASPKIPHSE